MIIIIYYNAFGNALVDSSASFYITGPILNFLYLLILDGVGLKKLLLSIAPLFTRVQTILEVVNRSCRHNMFRKSVPMFDCPLAKEM